MRTLQALVAVSVLAAAALAADPIKVLILDGKNNHKWRETTPVLRAILENTGRFRVEVATATNVKEYAPKFSDHDVVLSNYNGPGWPEATKSAFREFVAGGGGFVAVHAADNSFPDWRAYNEMIGIGGWGGRTEKSGPYLRYRRGVIQRDKTPGRGGSHGRQHEFLVVARVPDHPILKGLPVEWMHAKDELYDRLRGPAKNLTVLATAWSDPKTRGSGEHEPMLMAIAYGEGRVFHTTLGHSTLAMQGAGFQVTLQRGTEWAATGEVTFAPPGPDLLPADRVVYRDPEDIVAVAGWAPLFDGETLEGFTVREGTAAYRVEDGVIAATTTGGSPSTFLCTDRLYGDFELTFETKLDDPLNAGLQIRSAVRRNGKGGKETVHGPQVEIAANGDAGFVFGEALGTGWLSVDRSDPKKRAAFRKGEWNRYRVKAVGRRIVTWINGIRIADFDDEKSNMRRGFIGLQVHSVRRGDGPYRVRWRDLRIRDLSR